MLDVLESAVTESTKDQSNEYEIIRCIKAFMNNKVPLPLHCHLENLILTRDQSSLAIIPHAAWIITRLNETLYAPSHCLTELTYVCYS